MKNMTSGLRALKEGLTRILFPRVCPVCNDILSEGERAKLLWHSRVVINPYICSCCYEKAAFIKEPECFKCGRPLEDEEEKYCFDCAQNSHEYEYGMSLLRHDDTAKKILYDLKYSNLKDNADFLGAETALRLGGRIIKLRPDAVIPVPLHKSRERERGFNQAELIAEKVIENIEMIYGISLHYDNSLLVRHRSTKPQKELKRENRIRNIKESFSVKRSFRYKRILLVDDIYTTGSTIDECARVLKASGAAEIYFLTMSIV